MPHIGDMQFHSVAEQAQSPNPRSSFPDNYRATNRFIVLRGLFGAVPLLAILASCLFQGTAFGAPKGRLSPESFDFGHFPGRSTISTCLWLKAEGKDTVRVDWVDAGHGLARISISDSLAAPGDSIGLRLDLESSSLIEGIAGKVRVFLHGLDTALSMSFRANPFPGNGHQSGSGGPLEVSPTVLTFSPDFFDKMQVSLQNQSEEKITIETAHCHDLPITLSVPSEIGGRKSGALVAVPLRTAPEEFDESITLIVRWKSKDGPKTQNITIPVLRGRASGPSR